MIDLSTPLALDGALGTQLEQKYKQELESKGLFIQKHPLWSALVLLKEPLLIQNIHLDYLKSGADIITTATYQASKKGLVENGGLSDTEVEKTFNLAVDVANNAKQIYAQENNRKTYICGSVGPYGGYLANGAEYTGFYENISVEDLIEFHKPIVSSYYANDKVDIIGFETVPNFNEVKAILELMKNFEAKSYYISFNFKDSEHICDGTEIETVMNYLNSEQRKNLLGIGANCVKLSLASSIIAKISESNCNSFPLIVYPNAGLEYDLKTAQYTVNEVDYKVWQENCQEWIHKYNVKIIGGCCGSGPRDIAIIKDILLRN